MAKRKETPDILAELMGGASESISQPAAIPPTQTLVQAEAPQKSTQVRRSRKNTPVKTNKPAVLSEPAVAQWEYRLVSFQFHQGWRLRFMDGVEVPDWTGSPRIHEFLTVAGQDGWELVSSTSGQKMFGLEDNYQLYLKRIKKLGVSP